MSDPHVWTQAPSGNHGGKLLAHKYLVIHYTASDSAASSIAWLRTPASQASAHFVVDQAGAITQLVPCELVAWHVGRSAYKGDKSLNTLSLGIELVNPGPVSQLRPSVWASGNRAYTADEVQIAEGKTWATYPEPQIAACLDLVSTLQSKYGPMELVGHSEVCDPPGRKLDPGPAFPWVRFRAG